MAATAVSAAPRAIAPTDASVDFGCASFRLRLAAARAAVSFLAPFVGLPFAAERLAVFAFLLARRRGVRTVLLRLLDLVVRLRVTFDFLATVAPRVNCEPHHNRALIAQSS